MGVSPALSNQSPAACPAHSAGVRLCGAARLNRRATHVRPAGAPACGLSAPTKQAGMTIQPAGCCALLLSFTVGTKSLLAEIYKDYLTVRKLENNPDQS
ncbi:hypothetical protein JCM12856_03780 [Spirochaeta dissipatitropha]